MAQTDPIAELLTRIRNAMRARFNQVEIAHSNLREAICRVLVAEGFLSGMEVTGEAPKRRLTLGLRYTPSRTAIISGIQRVSRPSIRRYAGAKTMPRISSGIGVHIVSTPLGVMTDREARRKNVGGEVLLRVW